MDVEQQSSAMDNDSTMNLTGNTVIPLEYVEFELKHAKVIYTVFIYQYL